VATVDFGHGITVVVTAVVVMITAALVVKTAGEITVDFCR
jgi:hypothetical protein